MLKPFVTIAAVLTVLAVGVTLLNQSAATTEAHCQVPCGVFDEGARVKSLYEDATTIEKAMKLMNELAGKHDAQSQQQFVRWTNTKEEHASQVIALASEYFLAQRVKPVAKGADGYDAYLNTLALHHELIIAAMKAKQTTDAAAVKRLQEAIHGIEHVWVKDHKH